MYWGFNLSYFGRLVHAWTYWCLPIEIVVTYGNFLWKTCMKNTPKARCDYTMHTKIWCDLCELCLSRWMFISHLDWTVRLTTLSSKELTPSDHNSHLEKISSGYILICMLIVGTAEDGGHLYICHSLCVSALCTYSFLNLQFILCRGVFILYIGLFVKVTKGYPTHAVFPWNLGSGIWFLL
jgi:hypothetical protein